MRANGVTGYGVTVDPDEGVTEADSFTCFHCQRIIYVKPMCDPADAGGLCKQCMRLICPTCVGKRCVPFFKKLEAYEKKMDARRSYGF